jgi:hypothetical protein
MAPVALLTLQGAQQEFATDEKMHLAHPSELIMNVLLPQKGNILGHCNYLGTDFVLHVSQS